MQVRKFGGDVVPFEPEKVIRSVMKTGASREEAEATLASVRPSLYDGMPTKELYTLVHETLKGRNTCHACRYGLRDALRKLGPAGFKFEKYVAAILNAYNYDAFVPEQELAGACVMHEVDVVAEKEGRRFFLEAKFRNDAKDFVGLKDVMATWSRFVDLVDGAAAGKTDHFDECWIVTNARFSDRAKQFGACKGMHLRGWGYPEERSFGSMIDHRGLYPVTVLEDLSRRELDQLSRHGLMLCRQVEEMEAEELAQRIDIPQERAQELIELSTRVVEGEE
jgi:hypothetical protein